MTVRDGINVDPFIVLSIIGIESNYGLNGKYTFLDLYTQILLMPKRSKWAKRQLVTLLLLTRQPFAHSVRGLTLVLLAMDLHSPQASSRTLLTVIVTAKKALHWDDVIASITNYLIKNGYHQG